jgi:hypothetical protein
VIGSSYLIEKMMSSSKYENIRVFGRYNCPQLEALQPVIPLANINDLKNRITAAIKTDDTMLQHNMRRHWITFKHVMYNKLCRY